MNETKKEALTISIEDYCVDFAEECAKAIEFRIEHDCLDAVENRLAKHGYFKQYKCRVYEHTVDEREFTYECSRCGFRQHGTYHATTALHYSFCPSCGGRLVEQCGWTTEGTNGGIDG